MGEKRMARDHKWFLNRVSTLSTVWGLLPSTWQTAVVGVASAIAAYLGFQYSGLFFAFVGAAVVFCCGMVGIFFGILVVRMTGIFEKLIVREVGISDIGAIYKGLSVKEITHITFIISLLNSSGRNIYYRLHRGDISIMGHVSQKGGVSDQIDLVPPGQPQQIILATIEKIPVPKFSTTSPTPLVGKLILEIEYGTNRDSLPFLLEYEAEPAIGMTTSPNPNGKGAQTQWKLITPVKRHAHRKNKLN